MARHRSDGAGELRHLRHHGDRHRRRAVPVAPPQYAIWIPPGVSTAARTRAKSTTPASTSRRRPAPAGLLHAGDQPRHARRAGRFRAARHHLSGYAGRPAHGAGGDRPDAPGARLRQLSAVHHRAAAGRSWRRCSASPATSAARRAGPPPPASPSARCCATASSIWACRSTTGASGCAWSARWACWTRIAGAGCRAPARLQHALGVHRHVPTTDRGIARQRAAAQRRRAAGIGVGHCGRSAAPAGGARPANRVIHASDARHGRTRDNSA